MKTIKGALKRGCESVRSGVGDIAGGIVASNAYEHLTGTVAPS